LEVGGVQELDHGWVGRFLRCRAWILGTTGSVFQDYSDGQRFYTRSARWSHRPACRGARTSSQTTFP
jgi:hypothetical protein